MGLGPGKGEGRCRQLVQAGKDCALDLPEVSIHKKSTKLMHTCMYVVNDENVPENVPEGRTYNSIATWADVAVVGDTVGIQVPFDASIAQPEGPSDGTASIEGPSDGTASIEGPSDGTASIAQPEGPSDLGTRTNTGQRHKATPPGNHITSHLDIPFRGVHGCPHNRPGNNFIFTSHTL